MSRRFTYGDTLRISLAAPPDQHPGDVGEICGIRPDPYRAGVVDVATVGDEVGLVYFVEFPSGDAIELAEAQLEALVGDDITWPSEGP